MTRMALLAGVDTATLWLMNSGPGAEPFAYAFLAISFVGLAATANRWAEAFLTRGHSGETATHPLDV